MRKSLSTIALVALVWVAFTLNTPAGAQAIARIYGTISGAPIALTANSSGYLNVVVAAGSIPSPGSTTQVIFNDAGVLAGDAGMTYNKTTDALTLVGALTVGSCSGCGSTYTGTANQVIVTGTVLSTPQDIGTASNVAFGSVAAGTTPAAAGAVRIPNNVVIAARNNANNADVEIAKITTADLLNLRGGSLQLGPNSVSLGAPTSLAGVLAWSTTAPTIAAGGCTSPAVTWSNGTAAFLLTIGTSCSGVKTLTLTLPVSSHLWACSAENNTSDAAQQTNYAVARATTTTAVIITSYDKVTEIQEDFTAGDTYLVRCTGG